MALYSPCAHECADRPNLPCPACDWSDTIKFQLGQIVATPDVLEAFKTLGQSPRNSYGDTSLVTGETWMSMTARKTNLSCAKAKRGD
jgi:hypothetical protein